MILQTEVATEVVRNAFQTNPDTVFGVLVSILVLAVIALCFGIWQLIKAHKKEMAEIVKRHELADNEKYKDMKELSEKTVTAMTLVMSKLDVLITK